MWYVLTGPHFAKRRESQGELVTLNVTRIIAVSTNNITKVVSSIVTLMKLANITMTRVIITLITIFMSCDDYNISMIYIYES